MAKGFIKASATWSPPKPSKPSPMTLLFLAAAWLAGLYLGFRLDFPHLPLLLLAASTLPLVLALKTIGKNPLPAVIIGLLLLGWWRVEAAGIQSPPIADNGAQQVALRGNISDDPEPAGNWIRFVLDVDAAARGTGWAQQNGKVLVYAPPPNEMVPLREPPYYRYGDSLVVEGVPEIPKKAEGFDYAAYLASHGISGVLFSRKVEWLPETSGGGWRAGLFQVRGMLSRSLSAALPSPQSALAQGLLLGRRGQIPTEVKDSFRASGTAHLLAISGLHVGILLVMTTGASAAALGRRRQMYLLVPLTAIWLYALVSGLPVSVQRAALMGSLYLAATGLGRPHNPLPILALSAVLITSLDPLALTQVSFQLSFTAMAGVLLALPYASRASEAIRDRSANLSQGWFVWGIRLAGWTASGVIVSLGATLATMPLVAAHFQTLPLLGIPLTILALPALPSVLAGSFLTAVGGLVHPVLGQTLGIAAWVPLSYLVALVSAPPSVSVSGSWVSPPLVWGWYLVLTGLMLLPRGRRVYQRFRAALLTVTSPANSQQAPAKTKLLPYATIGALIVLAGATSFLWAQVLLGPDGDLHVYFLDVGQGDSALVVTPNGRQVLIDGGPGAYSATGAIPKAFPPWDRSLDLVVLTHPDSDHAFGLLEAMDQYQVGLAIAGAHDPTAAVNALWNDRLTANGIELTRLFSGGRVVLDDGVVLHALHPSQRLVTGSSADRNNNGLVLRLVYGEASFLFTADIEAESESVLARSSQVLASDVLKVPHHGSKTSSTAPFLERVNPSAAVISAGAGNRFGHPHPEVVDRLETLVGKEGLFQTAQHGSIHFATDGSALWVETQR